MGSGASVCLPLVPGACDCYQLRIATPVDETPVLIHPYYRVSSRIHVIFDEYEMRAKFYESLWRDRVFGPWITSFSDETTNNVPDFEWLIARGRLNMDTLQVIPIMYDDI